MSTDGWYAVVDTARDGRLYPLVQQCASQTCLISGEVDPVLAATLPYLVRLRPGEALAEVWRQHAPGAGLGITIRSPLPIDGLRRHLKKFLNARMPDGLVALFRFYDPAVLLPFLRSSSAEQVLAFFRDIEAVVADVDQSGASTTITCSPDGRLAFT